MIELESETITEVFVGFGQLGVKAENVAMKAVQEARDYLTVGVPVASYLADQIMLLLGIGAHQGSGGVFRTMALSPHATTNLEVLRRFLDIEIQVETLGRDNCLIRIEQTAASEMPKESERETA